MFCTTTGTMLNKGNMRRVFVRPLKRAKLPLHFSPHSLRHTCASLLLQQGESPAYVQRSSATPASSSPWTPTASGSLWGTRPPWTASMMSPREQMGAKW